MSFLGVCVYFFLSISVFLFLFLSLSLSLFLSFSLSLSLSLSLCFSPSLSLSFFFSSVLSLSLISLISLSLSLSLFVCVCLCLCQGRKVRWPNLEASLMRMVRNVSLRMPKQSLKQNSAQPETWSALIRFACQLRPCGVPFSRDKLCRPQECSQICSQVRSQTLDLHC